jgi:hypothetical protein
MDKKDLFAFFLNVFALKTHGAGEDACDKKINEIIEEFEITKLDIQRMQRYLNKCTCPSEVMNEDDDEFE